jgi:hypothetical protein
MPPQGKQKKSSTEASPLAAAADRKLVKQVQRRREAVVLKWDAVLRNLTAKNDSLTNRNGKTLTFEENKMVLLALRGYAELHFKMVKLGVQDNINWTTIEKEVAFSFGIKQEHVKNDLREARIPHYWAGDCEGEACCGSESEGC